MPHGNDPPPTGSNGDAAARQRRRTPARLIVPSAVDPARLNRRRVADQPVHLEPDDCGTPKASYFEYPDSNEHQPPELCDQAGMMPGETEQAHSAMQGSSHDE